jgi:hypothetical protein
MQDLRTAALMALEALESVDGTISNLLGSLLGAPDTDAPGAKVRASITALRAALAAEPEPEPVAWQSRVEEAFKDGFYAPRTYNDTVLNTPAEAWEEAKAGLLKPLAATPTAKPLTEQQMYEVDERARADFRLSQSGPRGQQITYWDSITPWLIRAVERAHGIGG